MQIHEDNKMQHTYSNGLQMGTTRTGRAREDNSSPCYAFEPGILKREGGGITIKMFAELLERTQEIIKWR